MKCAAALRLTAEICFYYAVLTMFPVFRQWDLPMAGFTLAALLVGLVAVGLKSAALRVLLSLIPGACFLLGPLHWMLVFPCLAWLYCVLFLGFGRFGDARDEYRTAFRWMLIVSVFVLAAQAISAMLFDSAAVSYVSLAYLAAFLLLSVLAMRAMQMGVSMDRRWQAYNLLTVVCTLLAAVGVSLLLYLLFSHSKPLLLVLVYPIRRFFEWLFGLFRFKEEMPAPSVTQPPKVWTDRIAKGNALLEEPEQHFTHETEVARQELVADKVMSVGAFLIICFLILIAVWLIVKLARRGKAFAQAEVDYEQTEDGVPVRARRRAKEEAVRGPAQNVRKLYREYLDHLQENGLQRTASDTSGEILTESARLTGASAAEEETLRRVYLKARYSGETVTEADVAEARACLEAIRGRAKS